MGTFDRAKAFLFDFDGTLVDSMPFWAKAMIHVLESNGTKYPEDLIRIITPLGIEKTAEYFRELGLNEPVTEIIRQIDTQLDRMYREQILAKAEVADCLKKLKEAGKILAVLTASPHRWLDPCLARNRLTAYFDEVWSSEDFDTVKTDPAIYREAAERLGVTIDEMVFLDDNLYADRAGKASGCRVIGVFDESGREEEPRIRETSDAYIRSFGELPPLVLTDPGE